MALQLPGIQYLTGYNARPDLVGEFAKGYGLTTGMRNEADARDALGEYVKSLYMGGQSSPQPPGAMDRGSALVNGSIDATQGATDPTLDAYFKSIQAAESGGNDAARNPNSSATGRYQFTDATWQALAQQHPELGLTPDGRTNPAQQEKAIRAFTNDNIGALRSKGLPVNPGNLYASHFLGAGGASDVLGLDDDTPMVAAVPPEVVQANPFLADMTVGQFKQWSAEKAGNGQGGYQAPTDLGVPQQPQTGAPVPGNGLPPREVLLKLFQNPETRGFAGELVKLDQAGQKLINAGSGSVFDPNTGQWLKDPNSTEKAPTVVELFDEGTGQPYKATWNAQSGKFDRVGGTKAATNGLTVTTNPDGTTTVTQGGSGKLTEAQGKDIGFYTRGLQANQGLTGIEGQLTDLFQSTAGAIPGVGNYLRTPEFRQAKVEADNFLTALLRKDTGAAITDHEFELYGPMFLPVPGDDPATIALKRQKRATALLALRSGLGTADVIAAANEATLGLDRPDTEAQGVGPTDPPQPGTVMDGYRFKGGDPSDENNWEPL